MDIEKEFEKIKDIEKESEEINKKIELLISTRKSNIKRSKLHLDQFINSVDAVKFLLYGSLLGMAINLITNIIHNYFSMFSVRGYVIYVVVVVWFLVLSLYFVFNFIITKWNKILNENNFLKGLVEGNNDPDDYSGKVNDLREKLNVLVERLKMEELRIKSGKI